MSSFGCALICGKVIIFPQKIQRYPVDFTLIKIYDRVTGQHDRQWKILSRQIAILAGHCPLTGRYFQPWSQYLPTFQLEINNCTSSHLFCLPTLLGSPPT